MQRLGRRILDPRPFGEEEALLLLRLFLLPDDDEDDEDDEDEEDEEIDYGVFIAEGG